MSWLRKKPDPLSERARALSSEIAALEAQIKNLDSSLAPEPQRKSSFRSTAIPHGETITHSNPPSEANIPRPAPSLKVHEPIFEEVGQKPLKANSDADSREHFNELGVRKYDVTALIRRCQTWFSRPKSMNPRLISYLAAGGVQGLQPLRKEKRVARNRFIALVAVIFLLLLGIISMYLRHR